jgi:hypothetical protein
VGVPTAQAVLEREQALDPSAWEALAQRDGETAKAHAAFVDYVLMGPGRSLRKLYARYRDRTEIGPGTEKPPTRRLATLSEWSAKHQWQDRLTAYQEERDRREQEAWEARRKAVRQADWEAGEALRDLAADILAETPNFLKTTRRLVKGKGGQPDREVLTVGIEIAALLKAIELASKLQALAAGVEPPEQKVKLAGKVTVDGVSVLGEVTPDMALAAQAALKAALEAGKGRETATNDTADKTSDGTADETVDSSPAADGGDDNDGDGGGDSGD